MHPRNQSPGTAQLPLQRVQFLHPESLQGKPSLSLSLHPLLLSTQVLTTGAPRDARAGTALPGYLGLRDDGDVSETERSREGGAGALPGFADCLAYMAAVM